MIFRVLIIWLVLLVPLHAVAQEAGPLIGGQATETAEQLVAPQLNDGVNRILVIGDSMAGGLGAGMTRMVAGNDTVQIVNRFNESSGITRPDFYDWAGALPKMMDGKNFTSVVVLIGLNDRQDIRNGSFRYVFNTPDWITAYQNSTDAILTALLAQHVKIFWLGEPPMGDPVYDADMQTVTALQKARVVAKGGNFIDTRAMLLSPEGKYVDVGPDDTGEIRKLRQKDGVTFLKQGNNKFGQLVLAAVTTAIDTEVASVVTPPAVVVGPQVASLPTTGPTFGQDDANGVAVLHGSADIVASAAISVQVLQSSSGGFQPAVGTAAERLYRAGEAAVAPVGRFDDFSYVAPTIN